MEANLTYLRREVMKYEVDPLHQITENHIKLRSLCVVKFGSEAVREVVASVCQELLPCRLATFARKQSRPEVVNERKKYSSPRVKNAGGKKTSTTSRMGYRNLTPRR